MKLLNRLLAALILALATGLAWIGGQLLLAGGSPYYAVAAALLAATAWLLWRQSPLTLKVYALLWTGTLLWALWESGVARQTG
jgi:quinoprotein glucose dehydrogenase